MTAKKTTLAKAIEALEALRDNCADLELLAAASNPDLLWCDSDGWTWETGDDATGAITEAKTYLDNVIAELRRAAAYSRNGRPTRPLTQFQRYVLDYWHMYAVEKEKQSANGAISYLTTNQGGPTVKFIAAKLRLGGYPNATENEVANSIRTLQRRKGMAEHLKWRGNPESAAKRVFAKFLES